MLPLLPLLLLLLLRLTAGEAMEATAPPTGAKSIGVSTAKSLDGTVRRLTLKCIDTCR